MQPPNRKALSLIELILAMAMTSILVLAGGVLLLGGSNAYQEIYTSVHKPIREDSRALTVAFKSIGRKSNRTNYTVYKISGGSYSKAQPDFGESIASGQAVEFRHWDKPFYELSQGMDEMDVTDTGTHYTLFYLEDNAIYMDHGEVLNGVGGVQNGARRTADVATDCVARDVDVSENTNIFSHEMIGGAGSGCVMLNVTLKNDEDETVEIKTATLLRVVWPQ